MSKTKPKLKPLDQWQELNTRQQSALTVIYQEDKKAESQQTARYHYRLGTQKAEVWRQLRYAPIGGWKTSLYMALQEKKIIDEGLGSTLSALERRGLCECSYHEIMGKHELLNIKLTNQGRAVARAGLGESAPKKKPKGQLKKRQWEALVKAYLAGNEGIENDVCADYGGFSWQWTWLRLRDYYGTSNGLVEEVRYFKQGKPEYKLVITAKGKEFYQVNFKYYQELYSCTTDDK